MIVHDLVLQWIKFILLDFRPHSRAHTSDTCPLSVRIVAPTNVSTWLGRQLHLFHLSDIQSIGDGKHAQIAVQLLGSRHALHLHPPSDMNDLGS
jgi:hypothetical protein